MNSCVPRRQYNPFLQIHHHNILSWLRIFLTLGDCRNSLPPAFVAEVCTSISCSFNLSVLSLYPSLMHSQICGAVTTFLRHQSNSIQSIAIQYIIPLTLPTLRVIVFAYLLSI